MNTQFMKWEGMYTHVKWFTEVHDLHPQPISEVITSTFLFWLGITLLVLLFISIFNEQLEQVSMVHRVHRILNALRGYQLTIFRLGLGIGLLLQLSTGAYLVPTFESDTGWVYALLGTAIAGLLHRRLLPVSGAALSILCLHALSRYGLFYSLDYMYYAGVIYYLFAANSSWKHTAVPVLYSCTGMSLAWLSMEKMTMASLACSLMHEYGLPTIGFTVEDFVLISAFVELGLAWAFIVGLMNRFTALIVSGIFLSTSTVFGFTEVVGHTVMHTIFLIFLIEGREKSSTLYLFHQTPGMRSMFVIVNFCILLFSLMAIYVWMGQPGNGFTV
ncbi:MULTISPECIES: hypothetical protein [Paenibacillus]|uniref:hypothetical protein n=1 Tax=Paenibacillus TaxID=44249 RepID=UPI0022B861F6|nr:hypothetical protein [Paenibacillus caseinilyticus]MCZ8518289.1 hypothetical protein [Paenibacillus caseinilyticus]